MSNPVPRPRSRPSPRDRRLIAELKRLPAEADAPAPDYADLACLLRAHREKAARVIDNQLIGDRELARVYAKMCRILEDEIEYPRWWANAARRERAFQRTMRRLG